MNERTTRGAWRGMIASMVVALVVLLIVAATLVSAESGNWKGLVAVWLWTLPALGLFSSIGWAIGALLSRGGRGSRA